MIFRGYIIRSARLTERRRDNTVGRSRRAVDRRPWPRWKGRLDGSPFAVCPQSQGSQERGAMTNQDMLSSASPPCQPSHPSHESHWPLAAKVTEVDFTTPKASLQHGGAPCSLSPSLFFPCHRLGFTVCSIASGSSPALLLRCSAAHCTDRTEISEPLPQDVHACRNNPFDSPAAVRTSTPRLCSSFLLASRGAENHMHALFNSTDASLHG